MVDNINSLPLNVQDNTDVVIEDNVKPLSSKATENEAINLFQRDILVFDKDETLIHIISADDYNDDVYKRQINKEWSFSFTVDVSLSDVIIRKNKIGVYDREGRLQLFIVEDITERYSKTPTMEVYCIHDSFILNDTVLEEFTVTDTIDNVLDSVLAGTSYQRGYTDQFDVADIDMQLTSRFGGLQTIAETFGGELDFRFTLDETRTRILNRYVDVKFSLGRDIGVRFTFDTNLTEVVRTVTSDNHFTVLYGLGRSLATGETKPDGSKEYKRVDFSEVAWGESTGNPTNKPVGQRYIEDTEGIKKWGRIEGIYINETITDPETLINRTWKQLQKCKEPSFSYSVTVEDLSKLAGYEHLSVGIGDTVIIKDEDFKLELSARIQEEQYSIKENIIKALDAESVPTPMSARAITGLSSHGGGNKKLVLGVLQRGFTEDNSGSGTVSPPTVDTGSGDVNVDNENFPDVLPATPIISGTGLFATIMTSWTFENSIYYGYELHGSQVENFITSQNTILARGKISSHLHQCKPGERWYFKVRAYNTHGNYTPFSNEIALESSKVADGTEWFENAAIGDALIGQLRLDRGWVGKLTGELIEARNLKVINDNNVDTLHIDNAGNVSLNVSSFSLVQGAASNVPTKNEMTNEINNIEIGGRNLIIRHTETKNTYIDTSGNIVNQNGYATSDYIELVPGGIMAFSKETVSSNDEYFRWAWYDSNKGYISRKAENSNKFKWNVPSGARYARISYHMDCYPKVERGTKHTGWSPSPEDVEYDIKNVSNNLESFENTVNTTFKDGIIEEAEAKAIAQNIKTLETTHIDMVRDYNITYANAYLTGTAKTNLASAKAAFDSAHNSLVSTINTVIADGRVTASEKASVDSTFNTYNSVLGTFRERLQEANKYISTAIVDGIQVGSRNYILDSDKSITGTVPGNVSVGGLADWTALQGKTVVVSLDINVSGMSNIEGQSNRVGYEMAIMWTDNTMTHIGIWHYVKDGDFKGRKWRTISIPSNKTVKSINYSGMYIQCNATSCVLARPQIEIGNKPTDWSPAVEDMESAYTIVLSNEAQVIPTNNSRVPAVSTTYYTDIQVYKGTTVRTDYSIGTISSANGITVSKTTSRVNFAVSTGTALTADGGTFTIPITIDGKTFNKTFSWSASKQGATGATGIQGPQGERGPQGIQGAQGSAGADAQYVIVTGEQVFKYTNNFSGTPTPSQIALTAQTTGITSPSYQWSYRVPSSTSVTNISGATSSSFTLTHNNSIWGSHKQLTLRCTSSGKYDEITLVKVSDGANGTNGIDGINGVNGADAYTIILTNESHTFPTENDGNIPTALTTTSDIIAYKGATRVSSSVGAVTNPSGLTISASSNGTTSTRLNITASTGTSLSDTGSVAIPITVDGKVFNKTFSWAKAKKGNVGATGSAGKGIKTIAEYYLVSTANTGVTTSTSGWATTVPTLTSTNRYLWNYETITYTDNSTSSTAPKVIGVYGDKGNTGATGATGNGIKSITNYYLVSASNSGITTATSGWTTTMQQTTTTNKYLWNYEVVAYTNGTSYTSIPVIIGTHGATGAAGANAKTLDLTATSLMFTSQDGGISWVPDNGITITATCTNTSVAKWWVSPNNGSTWEELTNNGTNSTLTVTRSSFTSRSTTSLLIKCVATDSTVFDTITIGQIIGYDESKIGNRNLAQKTSDEWQTYSTFNNKDNECILPYNILLKDFVVGDTINIYFKMKFENVVKGAQHTSGTIILQTSGDVTGWEANGNTSKQIEIPSGATSEIEVIHSVKMTADILENDMWFMDFRCNYIKSGAISIKCLMVVNGKLPTAWVPAPEDMIEYVDSSMQSMLASNNDIMDKIYLITSDNYISEAERADFKATYEQITSQYDTMCWTIDKMNVEYLNTYKTDLTSKYNVVVLVCKPIIENNLDTGAINVRNAIVDFFSSYNNALFAVSTYTKDQLTSISLRVETLNNEFKVSSVRADDAYNATLEMGKHMKFSENWLELYGTVNGASSQFKARLSNEALEFYDGDDVVASISNKKLNIANAEIKHSLTVGRFSISPSAREAGGVVFKYNS
nr:MAG TPA: tail protein [Caudoviricetes sp.]